MKNFNISCLDDFFLDGNMDVENILTAADKQIIVKHVLDNIKANEHEKSLPGSEHVKFISFCFCTYSKILLHLGDFLSRSINYFWMFGRRNCGKCLSITK